MPAVFAAALMLQAAAAAAPPPRMPKDFDVRTFYPTTAHRAGIEGKAVVDCAVASDGLLSDCRVVSETPAGFNFGTAAVRAYQGKRALPGAPGAPFPSRAQFTLNFGLKYYGPQIRVVAHDGWSVIQQPERWRDFYPGKARGAGVSGKAEVKCTAPEGKLVCEVLSENPPGHGFGDAALQVQQRLLLSPPPGGAKATGRSVRTTILFEPEQGYN